MTALEKEMKKVSSGLLAAMALCVGACATTHRVSPGKVGAVSGGQFHTIPAGYDPSVSGWPGAVGDIVQNAGSTSAWVRNGTADTAWQAFPSAASGGGLGSHQIIAMPNSAAASINTLEWLNQWKNNTAGAETAGLTLTLPEFGTQVPYLFDLSNMAGRQTATTSTATPTVTFLPRYDLLVITVGADTSTLTINGLDLDTDYEYELHGVEPNALSTQVIMRLNGDATNWVGVWWYGQAGGGVTSISANVVPLTDSPGAGQTVSFRVLLSGLPGMRKLATADLVNVSAAPATYQEKITAYSGTTVNVTSLVLNGALKTGTMLAVRRRGMAN